MATRRAEATVFLTRLNLKEHNVDLDFYMQFRKFILGRQPGTTLLYKEQSQRYRIVTLDSKTSEITEYGRREDSSLPPVWVENTQGVAFVTLGGLDNQSPKLLLGLGNQLRQVDTGYASLGIEPLTGNLLYLNQSTPDNTIRMFDTGQESFLSSPLGETNLPWGQLRVDPKGKWLASFWGRLSHDPLDLADQQTDTVTDIEFANNANNESRPPWAIDAAWSGNGKILALVLGYGDRILSSSSLALLNPKTLRWRSLSLPAQFITEVEWAPGNRFLLARGVPKGLDLADPYAFWLVDTKNRDWKEISYSPSNTFPEFPFMAWSREGRLAWLEGTSNGFHVVVTKVSPGR